MSHFTYRITVTKSKKMVSIYIFCFCLFFGLLSECYCKKRRWVDPTDMLNYDHRTKRMRNEIDDDDDDDDFERKRTDVKLTNSQGLDSFGIAVVENDDSFETSGNCCLKFDEIKTKYENCEKQKMNFDSCEKYKSDGSDAYLKRFIAIILQQFSNHHEETLQKFETLIKLSTSDRNKLEAFVNSKNIHAADVDDIISDFFVNVYPLTDSGEYVSFAWLKPELKMILTCLIVLATTLICIKHLPVWKTLVGIFFVSVFWHWKYMYEKAVVLRHIEITKNPDVPQECLPDQKISFWASFYQWISVTQMKNYDSCEKYYNAIMIDPMWDVSPLMALGETVAAFITTPLGLIGKNVGVFFTSMHRELPLFLFYIVMPLTLGFFLLIVLFLLAVCSNYRIQSFFIKFEPDHPPLQELPREHLQQLRNEQNEEKVAPVKEKRKSTCSNQDDLTKERIIDDVVPSCHEKSNAGDQSNQTQIKKPFNSHHKPDESGEH